MKSGLPICLLALAGIAFSPSAHAAVFHIPDGKYFELRQAVVEANSNNEPDTILLARDGRYQPSGGLSLAEITGQITLYGRGAVIAGGNGDGGRIFKVSAQGGLTVSDLNIVNITYSVDQAFHPGGVINNLGNALLRNTTIANITLNAHSSNVLGGVIANAGTMTLSNVTLSNTLVDGNATGSAVYNTGTLLSENSTVTLNRITNSQSDIDLTALVTTDPDQLVLVNTLLADNADGNCNMPVTSSGGNLADDRSCGLTKASDQQNTEAMLLPLAENGGGVLTHATPADSPAVDAGMGVACTPMDARGIPRPEAGQAKGTGTKCDVGAYEYRRVNVSFNDAVTGTWYDPTQSGHGLMVEMLPSGNQIFITWFVFDPAGNRDWIQALGHINNGIARFVAYRILGGAFPPAFDPGETRVDYWGVASLVMNDCDSGAFSWMSDTFGYSRGGMPLTRLTQVAGLECG